MRVQREGPDAFIAEFESEEEVREQHRLNLAFGALSLPTDEQMPKDAVLRVTLRGPSGAEAVTKGSVIAPLPGAIALAIDVDPDAIVAVLLATPPGPPSPSRQSTAPVDRPQTAWDRMRALPQAEKIIMAVRADRSERALLLQDNDPRVLLSLLRNPQLTIEEVTRLAKSSFLTFQIAEVIMQTALWMNNLDVRRALIYNPKTPQAFALRILTTLPDAEVRLVARSATNTALKQAALRKLQGGS